MKNFAFIFLLFFVLTEVDSQRFFSKNASVRLYSNTPLEKIDGSNNASSTVMDIGTGNIEFATLINGFQFEKALMQEHFNENYMESGKFPKATFKGKLEDLSQITWNKNGTYKTNAIGKMTIHGVTRDIQVPVELIVKDQALQGMSKFKVKCEDYGIKIPSVVKDKIAKEIEITVNSNYQAMKK